MKLLLQTSILLLFFVSAFTQEMPNIEVVAVEYVWERLGSDNRIVFGMDTIYHEVLKRSFITAISEKWNANVAEFDIKVNKLPVLRTQPKFNTPVSNIDTSKWYIFLQFFDKSIPIYANNSLVDYSLFSARINTRYRLIKGGDVNAIEDRKRSFKILQRNPAAGQTPIKRFPFHPSQFKYLCDTIISTILNDEEGNDKEILLDPACGYSGEPIVEGLSSNDFQCGTNRLSVSVAGKDGFKIVHDTVNVVQTGKKKHTGDNIATGLLTLFANIDTEKKRSALMTADHKFSDGTDVFHAYMSFIDTKFAERHRVKDDEGLKSIEVGEYERGGREINPDAKHIITFNGDTVSSFNIRFREVEEHFTKKWNGRDTATVDDLQPAFNNYPRFEMEMKGTFNNDPFILITSDGGKIKKITLNGNVVFTFYSNSGTEGILGHRKLDEHELKLATLLCLLSDKYY